MKRLAYPAYLLAATFLLLELALQLGHAVVVFSRTPSESPLTESTATVLCVGDSYTFGVGARSPEGSYPGQLEGILRERLGPGSRVLNAGWPSQNTYDVASRLQGQLEASSPAFVSILVGTNDRWKHPRRYDPEAVPEVESIEPAERFVLQLRTAKLLRILLDARKGAPGRLSESDRAAFDSPDMAPSGPPATRARWMLRESRYADALATAEEGLGTHPQDRQELQRIQLVAFVRLGQRDEAGRIVDEFEVLHGEDPTKVNAEYLLAALENTGRRNSAYDLAMKLTRRHPDIELAWRVVGWRAQDRGDSETAAASFEASLAHTPLEDRALRAHTMRTLAGVVKDREPDRSVQLIVDAMLLDGESAPTVGTLRTDFGGEAANRAVAHLETLDLDDTGRRLARDLLEGLQGPDAWDIAAANLEAIVEASLAAGVTPILLSYPFCPEELTAIQSTLAQVRGVRWIDVCARFRAELEERPREELFVSDGHCTEAGYEIIAELVAEAIVEDE